MTTETRSPDIDSSKNNKKTGTFVTLNPEELEDLKCIRCTMYLSGPPIMFGKDGSYCGDCGVNADEELLRNWNYEKLAAKFEFPCSFKGCEKKLPFKRISQHQKNCDFRQYECPLYSGCWRGDRKQLKQHIITKHNPYLFNKGTFMLKHSETYKQIGMLIIEDQFFVVEIFFDTTSKEFEFTVKYVGSPIAAGMFKYYLQMAGNKIAKSFCTESKSVLSETSAKPEAKHKTKLTITELLAYLKQPTTIECRVFVYNKADFADQTRSTSLQNAASTAEGDTLSENIARMVQGLQ